MSARWVRKDYPTIMSGKVVRYRWRDAIPAVSDPEINASRDGVSIQGPWPVMSLEDVDRAIAILRHAIAQHVVLRNGASPIADGIGLDDRKGMFG